MKRYFIILFAIFFTLLSYAKNSKIDSEESLSTKNENVIEIKNTSLDKLVNNIIKKEKENDYLAILFPLLTGAFLTLFAQLFVEWRKTFIENKNKKIELVSNAQAKTYIIAQVLKDLAMYKVHKQYYIKTYKIQIVNNLDHTDNHNKQYEKGQEQRQTEAKLDELIADHFKIISHYLIIAGKNKQISENLDKILNFEHPKSEKFENCLTEDDLVTELGIQEKKLNDEYKKFIDLFKAIQSEIV